MVRLHGSLGVFPAPRHLLLNKDPRFRLLDLLCPVRSPSQPLENTIGAVALYLLAFVVVTSYLRLRLGRRLWKSFHFSIYFAAAALFFHSLWTAPGLKNDPIDWLDGGKLFVESCFLLIASIGLLRWRHSRRKAAYFRRAAAAL